MRSPSPFSVSPPKLSDRPPTDKAIAPEMLVPCTPCGTLRYCAPEVLLPGAYRRQIPYAHAFKRDIFSLGIVVYTMLSGQLPYQSTRVQELLQEMSGPMPFPEGEWADVSPGAGEFVLWLCQFEPALRPTAAEALQHPWIRQYVRQNPPMGVRYPVSRRQERYLRRRQQQKASLSQSASRPLLSLEVEEDSRHRITVHQHFALGMSTPPVRSS